MHNRWTMNLFLGFYVPILEEICTTFLGKVRAQQCESLIQKIPSNPTLQYGRDRPSPQTPVNNTVTIFCQRADTTSLIPLPLMSSRGEFNWIQDHWRLGLKCPFPEFQCQENKQIKCKHTNSGTRHFSQRKKKVSKSGSPDSSRARIMAWRVRKSDTIFL